MSSIPITDTDAVIITPTSARVAAVSAPTPPAGWRREPKRGTPCSIAHPPKVAAGGDLPGVSQIWPGPAMPGSGPRRPNQNPGRTNFPQHLDLTRLYDSLLDEEQRLHSVQPHPGRAPRRQLRETDLLVAAALLRVVGSRVELAALQANPAVQVLHPSARRQHDGQYRVDVRADPASLPTSVRATPLEQQQPDPTGYLSAADISDHLHALAHAHPDVCSVHAAAHRSHEGRSVHYLSIGDASRPVTCLLVAGMHAREWAPPDALLSFAGSLVTGTLAHSAFVRAGATYAAWAVAPERLAAIRERVRVLVVPLANPDGRDFSLGAPVAGDQGPAGEPWMWRKNRRPAKVATEDGVDLNRNFDIGWDFNGYYTAAAASTAACSTDPSQETYIGPAAASEPETRNIARLIDYNPIGFFCDVHAYSRDVLYPWGLDTDQAVDKSQSWRNHDWDRSGRFGGRDAALGNRYGEYLPDDVRNGCKDLAASMAAAARSQAGADRRAQQRSTYVPKTELGLYPNTGNSVDYVLSRWLLDPTRPSPRPVAIECGDGASDHDQGDDDGAFWPDHRQAFPKVEREVHAMLVALLEAALAAAG